MSRSDGRSRHFYIVPPFGENFATVLQRLGLKQEELGDKLGIVQSSCSRFLSNLQKGLVSLNDAQRKVLMHLHWKALLAEFGCTHPVAHICDIQRHGRKHALTGSQSGVLTLQDLAVSRSFQKEGDSAHELDIYLRSVDLPSGMRVICFGNASHREFTNTFVVLVSRGISPSERSLLAWQMVAKYVAKRLRYTPSVLIPAYSQEWQQHVQALTGASPIPHTSSVAWSPHRVRFLIDSICVASHYRRQNALARELGCDPGLLSRWYAGSCLPDEWRAKLVESYMRSGVRLLGAEKIYVLQANPEASAHEAGQLSFETLCDALFARRPPSENALHLNLHIRLADLSPDALAHTLGNRAQAPDVFFVLVAKKQSEIDIIETTWAEVYAHVMSPSFASPQSGPAKFI